MTTKQDSDIPLDTALDALEISTVSSNHRNKDPRCSFTNHFRGPQPSLPSDVITVIAAHLAGDCAFRSLASLNIADHETHEGTLPVLYETLLADRPDKTRVKVLMDPGISPNRFRYTRSVYPGPFVLLYQC